MSEQRLTFATAAPGGLALEDPRVPSPGTEG